MVKCPNCGKTLEGPGFEFGTVIKQLCYECSCGASVCVQKEPVDINKLLRSNPNRNNNPHHKK